MKLQFILALVLVSLLASTGTVCAQDKKTVDRKEIEFLLELDYDTQAIIAYLGEENRVLKLDKIDLRFMKKKKLPEALLTWLEAHLPKKSETLGLEDIVAHWNKNKDEARLLKLIAKSKFSTTLSVAETLRLNTLGIPKKVLVAMRSTPKKQEIAKQTPNALGLDDVVLMANDGKSDEEIIKKIKDCGNTFDIEPSQIVELKSDGLSIAVIRLLYARRTKKVEKKEAPTSQPTAMEVESPKVASDTPEFELFDDKGLGISMLKPSRFVTTREFQSTKALIQMVAPIADNTDALPELELSVMVVHPRKKSKMTTKNPDLLPVASTFSAGLKAQFAKDGIDMVTEKPRHTWLANSRALRIATQAQVKETRAGYQGASYLLRDNGRFFVVSYSMRLEKAHKWRPILEDCVQSLVLDSHRKMKPADMAELEKTSPREQAFNLFESWRKSIRRLDFKTYLHIHYGLSDDTSSRLAFLNLARGINEAGNRVEINAVDFKSNIIRYNVFSVDGMDTFKLGFAKDKSGLILVRSQARSH